MGYTVPQQYAVEKDHGNLLVSAAAGSGKTFTLSAHIVELVKTGRADIGEMLVVTFTRTAAADMKRKIGESLRKAANEAKSGDPATYSRLSQSAAMAQSADISTIHSFLYRILKKHFPELGLPQDSRLVSNEALIKRMKAEAMRDTVNDLFEEGSEDFLYLADILATVRETEKLDEELGNMAAALSSNGMDAHDLGRYADMLESSVVSGADILSTPFGKPVREAAERMIGHYLGVFRHYADEFEFYTDVGEKYGGECAGLIEWLTEAESVLSDGSLGRLSAMLAEYKRPRLATLKEKTDFSVSFQYHRDTLGKDVKRLVEKLGRFTPEEILLSRGGTVRVLRCMEKAIGAYFDCYSKRKRELSMLDFGDLEYFAQRLLVGEDGRPTAAAREIGEKYKYIFIDEYQDTNSAQDAIFYALASNARRFMVGDIKQAIYRFRGADPSVFSEYRRKWETVDPAADGGFGFDADDGRVLLMSDNFRSAEPVTSLTNAVSDYLMPHGGIPYTDGDRLICSKEGGRDAMWPDSEVVVIEKKKGSGKDDGEEPDDGDPEVEYVADRIASLIGTYVGDRIIAPEDIAILLRSGNSQAVFRDALVKRGVPVFIDREIPLSVSPAVLLMMCVLNFVDNPLRDVYSAGALRSPVFGFNMDELIKLRGYAGKLPLYIGVIGCANDDAADDALRQKCADAIAWTEREKTVARGMSPSKYLEYLIDAADIFSIDGIRENGAERDAVNRFCSLAAEFEAGTSSPVARADLSAFLDYAAEALEDGEKNGEKPAKASGSAVSVMTIHKSKGLEFPVVFVSECGARLNIGRDAENTVTFNKDLGLGMYLPDESGLARCDTFFRRAVGESITEECVNEEMRVLYVALSRAECRLIVTAKTENLDTLTERTANEAAFGDGYAVRKSPSYISWILGALERQKPSRVTLKTYFDGEVFAEMRGGRLNGAPDGVGDGEGCGSAGDYGERCAFEYPYGFLSALPSKLTVSKLAPDILDDGEGAVADISSALDPHGDGDNAAEQALGLRMPSFMTGEKAAGASEKGTATHVFMQFADPKRIKEHGARAELERLVEERFMPSAQAELVSLKQIERFAESSLMDKLLRSDFVKREFRFNVRMDAALFTQNEELRAELGGYGAKVTVQGVVDCVFRDPDTGELTLIDYKTDSMTEAERSDAALAEEKLRARHTNQLTYYRKICAEMFGEEIPHAYVYSTVLGRLVEV